MSQPLKPAATRRAKPASLHPSIVALMKEALSGEMEEDVMRRKCRAMVAYARTHKWIGPPYCPKLLAGIHGVQVEDTDETFDGEGRIFPRRGRVVIQVKRGVLPERRRFTICHELAHTCFPDAYEFIRHHDPAAGEAEHKRFEALCDVGAAELLLPHEDFTTDLLQIESNMVQATFLCSRYNASIEAVLRRLLALTTHNCVAAFLTDQAFKSFPALPGGLRIKYFLGSPAFKGFLPPGTILPANSAALAATTVAPASFPTTRETWLIDDRPKSWFVEALRLPEIPGNNDYPKVVALLHPEQPRVNGR